MESPGKRSTRPKTRQSLAHVPARAEVESLDMQNRTTDLSVLSRAREKKAEVSRKRTRGKSLGPGGLEMLKETSGNAVKAAVASHPRSILKPTVPLTPPKTIPSFDELRKKGSAKTKSPTHNSAEALLIDFSTPAPNREAHTSMNAEGTEIANDPFSPARRKTDNHEDIIQKEFGQGEEERRLAEKKAILERRAARRKSMANRRVSFAPEATLHTWSVMELQEDSTTSSASNSTRRQSSITAMQAQTDILASGLVEVTATPEKQERTSSRPSPASRSEIHGVSSDARTSGSRPLVTETEAMYSSSPSGDVTTDSSPVRVEDSIDSESDTDGDTAMSMDDTTSHTVGSPNSSTQSSLDERLRQAASQAGTRGINYDEHGDDLSMELADGTVTNAFQPWMQNQHQQRSVETAMHDQENIDPFTSGRNSTSSRGAVEASSDDTQGMTMDMTKAIGGIVRQRTSSAIPQSGPNNNRRKSNGARRQSSGTGSDYGDETMDMTMVAGGILPNAADADEDLDADASDQDMTMELTRAVGGVQSNHHRRASTMSVASDDNETMDMTTAFGGILAPIEEHTEPQTDIEDDRTSVVNKALPETKVSSKHTDQRRSVYGTASLPAEAIHEPHPVPVHQLTSIASENGSPSLALKARHSARSRAADTPRTRSPQSAHRVQAALSPLSAKHSTPQKQLTPVPSRALTPERTPVTANVAHRSASPKKLFQKEIQARASPQVSQARTAQKIDPLFADDVETGQQTPKYVLHASKPHQHLRRRSSGVGIDKEGYGSPRVAAMLDRRSSIHEVAPEFRLGTPKGSVVKVMDPKQLEREVDAERAEEERRESGRFILEQEADAQQEENATLQLKDLINSMTPKKNKVKGRKSFAVGSARGLLGKRPVELDEDQEDDGEQTPKRLKVVSRESSPVKTVHLPKPPSKEETTGRLTRKQQVAIDARGLHQTPTSIAAADEGISGPSPQPVGRYKDTEIAAAQVGSFENKLDNVIGALDLSTMDPQREPSAAEEKVSLQDFLNMTNIHFIELSTTKRRHTTMQSSAHFPQHAVHDEIQSMAASLVAATTTIPLLELYQHATRELKSYISSGRKIIRDIEAETLAEQPPLFREYIEARPDVKVVMDNQFRNGKSNARLQSKEGWYAWRSQLVDGLRSGLQSIKDDLHADLATLTNTQALLDLTVPNLSSTKQALQVEVGALEVRLKQLDSVDHEQLKAKRRAVQIADQNLIEKLALLEALREQMDDKEETLGQAAELKTEMQEQITEAQRVKEEYRGWMASDVLECRRKVDQIVKASGWCVLNAEEYDEHETTGCGTALTLGYKNSLKLFFYPAAFQRFPNSQSRRGSRRSKSLLESYSPISLSFAESLKTPNFEVATSHRFFLQHLRSQIHALSKAPTGTASIKNVLNTVAHGWTFAEKVAEEVRQLNTLGLTRASIRDDQTLAVNCMVIRGASNRVDVEFLITVSTGFESTLSHSIHINVTAVYGSIVGLLSPAKTKRVQVALMKEVESRAFGNGALNAAIQGFEKWHCGQTEPRQSSDPKHMSGAKSAAITESPELENPPESAVPDRQDELPKPKRSPLAVKKVGTLQKKTLPLPTARHLKSVKPLNDDRQEKDKENLDESNVAFGNTHKPAITPQMQEAMMQHTPIKRIGALRRSPVGGSDW